MQFCVISRPEVATPPALTALPGANRMPACWNAWMASGVQPMFETSAQHQVPLASSSLASSPFSSFWKAHGRAMSHLTDQAFLPGVKVASGNFSAKGATMLRFEARSSSR